MEFFSLPPPFPFLSFRFFLNSRFNSFVGSTSAATHPRCSSTAKCLISASCSSSQSRLCPLFKVFGFVFFKTWSINFRKSHFLTRRSTLLLGSFAFLRHQLRLYSGHNTSARVPHVPACGSYSLVHPMCRHVDTLKLHVKSHPIMHYSTMLLGSFTFLWHQLCLRSVTMRPRVDLTHCCIPCADAGTLLSCIGQLHPSIQSSPAAVADLLRWSLNHLATKASMWSLHTDKWATCWHPTVYVAILHGYTLRFIGVLLFHEI